MESNSDAPSMYTSNTFDKTVFNNVTNSRFSKKVSEEGQHHYDTTKIMRPITISNEGRNQAHQPVTMNFYSNRPGTMGGNLNSDSRPMTISNFSRN